MALWVLHAAAGVVVAVAVHVLSNAKYVCAVSFHATLCLVSSCPTCQRVLVSNAPSRRPVASSCVGAGFDTEQVPQRVAIVSRYYYPRTGLCYQDAACWLVALHDWLRCSKKKEPRANDRWCPQRLALFFAAPRAPPPAIWIQSHAMFAHLDFCVARVCTSPRL